LSNFAVGILISAKDQASAVFGQIENKLSGLDQRIGDTSKNIAKAGAISMGAGVAILAPIKGLVSGYQDLKAAQGEIASLGIDDKGIKSITKGAREFTKEFAGTTAPEFIKASYDIKSGISSLSDTAVGEFTKTAALTAGATKSSTSQMTSLFATGFGIYRKQFDDFGASSIQGWNALSDEEKDIKFGEYFSAGISSSVQAFKTDGGNMSSALGTLGANATSAGVSFAEQLSILGQLQATMSGSEAATKYKAFLGSAQGAGDKLGLQFTDANNQMLSMPEIISKIKDKYGDTVDALESAELKKAFGTEEAVGLVKLLYNETDTLTKNIDSMGVSLQSGTKKTLEMAKATNQGKEFEVLGQKLGNAADMMGSFFAPAALVVGDAIGDTVTAVTSWMEENEELSGSLATCIAIIGGGLLVVGAFGTAVGLVGMAVPALTVGFGVATTAIGFMGTAMATVGKIFLTNPVGLAVTGIAAGAYLIYHNWDTLKSWFGGFFDYLGSKFEWMGASVTKVKGMASSVSSFFGFGDDENTPGAVTKDKESPSNKENSSQSIGSTISNFFGFDNTTEKDSKSNNVAVGNNSSTTKNLLKSINSNKQVTNQIQVAPVIKVDVKEGRIPENMGTQIQTLITQAVNNASNGLDNSTSLSDGEF